MLTPHEEFACPWCGEPNALEIDPDEVGQWLVQDCRVCCRPIELRHDAETQGLDVRREGE